MHSDDYEAAAERANPHCGVEALGILEAHRANRCLREPERAKADKHPEAYKRARLIYGGEIVIYTWKICLKTGINSRKPRAFSKYKEKKEKSAKAHDYSLNCIGDRNGREASEGCIDDDNNTEDKKRVDVAESCYRCDESRAACELAYHLRNEENNHKQARDYYESIAFVSCLEISDNCNRACSPRDDCELVAEDSKHEEGYGHLNGGNPSLRIAVGQACGTRPRNKRADRCVGRHCCHGK